MIVMSGTTSVRITRTVNLQNYESCQVSMELNGIPVGATREQVEEAMQTAELTFDVLQVGMAETIKDALKRSEKGLLA